MRGRSSGSVWSTWRNPKERRSPIKPKRWKYVVAHREYVPIPVRTDLGLDGAGRSSRAAENAFHMPGSGIFAVAPYHPLTAGS